MAQSSNTLDFSNFAEVYEALIVGPLFRPWAKVLLERVGIREGDRLLDVACGTGIVARLGRERVGDHGSVVGVDLSPAMIAVARRVEPRVDWREGDASALPVRDDERFDVVTCQQGFQFFPDKAAAAGEMLRVMAPAGRFVAATWRPVAELPLFAGLQEVVERHVGPVVDQRHSFGDDQELASLLTSAGFRDVEVEVMSRPVRFSEGSTFARLNAAALVGMSASGRTMSDEQRAATIEQIAKESEPMLVPYSTGHEVEFEISTNVATARR